MDKKRLSMRMIILCAFTLLMITTFSVIFFIVFSNWKGSVNNIINNMESDASTDIITRIETFINVPLYINEVNHNLIEKEIIDIYDRKARDVFFAGVMQANKEEVYSFSYGTNQGEYYGARRNPQNEIEIMRSDAETDGKSTYYSITDDLTSGEVAERLGEFDPRTRDWYKIAEEKGKPIFSPIYEHFVMNDLAITASYPIYDHEGALKGVLGTHFTLAKINAYLEESIKDKMATAYIVEKGSGALVANSLGLPNSITLENALKRITIEEIDNEYIKRAYLNYQNNLGNNHTIKTEHDKLHINFTDFKKDGLNWIIITAIPESQFIAEITKNITIALVLSIIALIISIVIFKRSTEVILKPIYNLINTTEKFSQGNFSERAKVYRNDEIGKLSLAFNKMAEELHLLINNLEEKVKERTRELENTNRALKRSEGDIRLLLDSTAEAICGIDMDGNCTFCNASLLQMLGYKNQDELIGKNMHRLIHYKLSDGTILPVEKCKICQAFIKGESAHADDEVFWRADGAAFPVEYYSYPQYRDGEVVGAVVTFTDITERLESRNAIIKAKEEAEAANKAKSQFLASMSHEIRTPMNGIIGFLQILENTELNKEQLEFINTIKTSTDTLLAVINDILDISKIESGKLELEHISFDIRSTIETTVIPFAAKASEKGIELNMLIRSNIPRFVMGDPTKLRQVIGNMTSNAIKFTDQGEVFIEVSLNNETDTGIELLFTVRDTGIGMSKEEINKLFKPFTQADSSSTRKYGGTGLGLAICKSIVEIMQGRISVVSEKGKGSIFKFTVALNKAAENLDTPMTADYSILKGKRILIVDDHAMNRHIAKIYLQEAGCMVSESENASDALNKLFTDHGEKIYNVILVDYQMPGMTGFDMAAALKAIDATEEIPLVLITSVAIGGDVKHAKRNGFAGYLSKPYRKHELLNCIAMVLSGKKYDLAGKNIFVTRHTAHEANYHGRLKILLVEDNEINIRVFVEFLKKKGLSCDVALNGEEAVQACSEKNYDLIFMDCQMPVMDGYEATRQIRKAEGDKKHTVIISMTAFAMESDTEKCLQAGMDDFISKPFSLGHLMKIIHKYRKDAGEEHSETTGQDGFSQTLLSLMKESGFDQDTCADILNDFCIQTDKLIQEIRGQIDKNNLKEAGILIHQLKGSAGNVRAKEIADYALQMEEAAKNSDREELGRLLPELESLLKVFREKR
ncbi:MAG: response regulator [Dehalobacterium sp.]